MVELNWKKRYNCELTLLLIKGEVIFWSIIMSLYTYAIKVRKDRSREQKKTRTAKKMC